MIYPFFSIVIPTFNQSAALLETVQSVLSQTFQHFEVIIVDVGSTDDKKQIASTLMEDSRIKYFWMPNSGGPATPRNKGIEESSAGWICFLDSDDVWYPEKLGKVYNNILENQEVSALCNNEMIDFRIQNTKKILQYGPFSSEFYKTMLLEGNRCSTSAMTINKSFINRYLIRFNTSKRYVIVEDFDMWLRMAFYGANFLFINEVLGEYVIKDENISNNVTLSRRNEQNLLYDHVFLLQTFELNKPKLWRKIKARMLCSYAVEDFKSKRLLMFATNILSAFFVNPFNASKWLFHKVIK